MNLIVCIDDKNGMAFHQRRQSMDRMLRENIMQLCGDKPLWMDAYSARQFADRPAEILLREDAACLEKAEPGEYCFVETVDPAPYAGCVEKLILYKWNRHYPADLYFTISLSDWKLEQQTEFAGSSHEKITREVYGK